MSGTGSSDDAATYDPNQPISVLGDAALPPQWLVGGDPSQPSILGGAFNPQPWTPAQNSLQMIVDPDTMAKIDFSGTAPPEAPPWLNGSDAAPNGQNQSPQPDTSGFTGLTPWQPDPTLSGARPVSDDGLDFIKRYELNPKTGQPYLAITPDDYGNPTFGYGHLVSSDEQPGLQAKLDAAKTIDQRQALADSQFADDIGRAQANVFNRLGSQGVASLSQPQYDALVADSFNAGRAPALGPNMAQDIKTGDLDAAGQQFNAYYAQPAGSDDLQPSRGLVRRNLQEAKLFNTGDYTYDPRKDEVNAVMATLGPKPRR